MRKQVLLNPARMFIILVLSIIPGLVVTAGISYPAVGGMLSNYMVDAWAEPSVNPVYDPATKAYYPAVLKLSDADYRMWYGSDQDSGYGIGYAISSDGVAWTEVANPVNEIAAEANHPLVEYIDGKFRMWYWDDGVSIYGINAIRYAESDDGITWTNDQTITGDIISGVAGQWNGGSYGAIDVFYNPSPTNTEGDPFSYAYTMYYDATTGGLESVGLGYSDDGIDWTLYGEVLPVGGAGAWDSNYTTIGSIVRESDGMWHMWYSGGQAESNEGIGHAYSADGLTWKRDTANPILHKNDGIAWRDDRTYTPEVIKDGDTYKMWFSAKDSGGNYTIGYTTSTGAFSTIQSAIDAATPYSIISVAPGLYPERISITKPLTLLGPTQGVSKKDYEVPTGYNWDATVEAILTNPNPLSDAVDQVVLIKDTDNVIFDGFVIQSLYAPKEVPGTTSDNDNLISVVATTKTMNNIRVDNCIIGPNTNIADQDGTAGRMGLYISIHNEYGLTNSSFKGNKTFDCLGNGNNIFIWGRYGLYSGTPPTSMEGTVIEDFESCGSHRSGIEIAGGITGLTIRNGSLHDNGHPEFDTDHDALKYGNGLVIIRGSSDADGDVGLSTSNLVVENLDIYGNEKNGIYHGPVNKNIAYTDCNIHDNGWDGIRVDLEAHYINKTFEDGDRSRLYNKSENVQAYSCSIHANGGYGVQVVGEPTNGFILKAGANWWGAAEEPVNDVSGAVIYDPWYTDETKTILATNKPIQNTTQNTSHDTIQAAIDVASPGDTIVVSGGTYAGAAVTNPVILRPAEGETVVINSGPLFSGGLRAGFYFAGDYSGSGTTISGLLFEGTNQGARTLDDDDGLLDLGIYAAGADDVTVTECRFTDTMQAITNWHGDDWFIDNNLITDLWTSNGGGIGILIGARDGTAADGNTVTNNGIQGTLSVYSGESGGYDGQGIVLYTDFRNSKAGGTITGTTVSGNDISVQSDNPDIINFNGIELTDTREQDADPVTISDNRITGNNIHGNSGDGMVVSAGVAGNVIGENKIADNHNYAIINSGTDILTAIPNWWGTADSTEIASMILGSVDYDPYYDSEAMENVVTDKPVRNQIQNTAYDTIQKAIDAADEGDTITVAAGNYEENLVVDKCVSVIGALTGVEPATFITPVMDTPVVSITASGISSDEPLLLQNLHIHTSDQEASDDGKMTGIRVVSPGNPVTYIKLDNVTVIGCHHAYPGLESGFALSPDTSLSDVTITNCLFKDLSYGIASIGISSENPGFFRNVSISHTVLEKNAVKGFYTERLSDAAFTNVTVIDNGNASLSPSWADPWNAGIDINLKYGDYENITLTSSTFLRNGIGHENGTGLTIKARGTGNDPSYVANHATLDGVTITGGTFNGNVTAMRFGDPGTDNEWPKNITINNVTILKNNASGGLINNLSGVTINAINNYWESQDGPVDAGNTYNTDSQGSSVTGSVSYVPWLDSVNGASFAPITNRAASYASIQSAINEASPGGDIIVVGGGTYTESPVIDKSLTLFAPDGTGNTKMVGAETVLSIEAGNDVVIDGFEIDGSSAESRGIEIQGVTEGNTVTIRNCYIHDNSKGINAEQIYGTLNILDSIIADNDAQGIYISVIEAKHTVNILRNDISDNGEGVLLTDISQSTINIRENSISGNDCGLAFSGNSILETAIDISGNYFLDNTLGIRNDTVNTVVAENNFWGTVDGDDIADRISGDVDYDPWHLKSTISEEPVTQITTDSLILNWTSQNTLDGDYYDFRYSTSPINNDNKWSKATRITGEPVPADGDQSMIIRGLESDTDYYFVLKVVYKGVSSEELNIDTATDSTVVPDTTAPAVMNDLDAGTGYPGTTCIILTWEATGDDGDEGFASKYLVKRSLSAITQDNFGDATTVYQAMKPKKSGKQETLEVNKLQPGTTYYFMIQAVDEAGNPAFSNSISFTTENNLPTVTAILPHTGDNGQNRTITITGMHFVQSGSTVVRLVSEDNSFKLSNVRYVDSTELTAKVPKGVPTGEYRIRVINSNGTSKLGTVIYTVTEAPVPLPVVTNVSPNLASSTTSLTGVKIIGKNLSGATAVAVDGTTATSITVVSDTQIIVDIPGLSAGEYDVKVTTPSGENSVSAVKLIVSDPVVIDEDSTEDAVTSDVITLDTNVTPVQITLTTDDSETATKNTDNDAEISVVIPPNTTLTDDDGNAYTGTINPPRVVKPDETIQKDLPEEAVVIEMGNPEETITFNQEFVVTVAVSSTAEPDIYYYNKTTDIYELAGKTGSLDGVDYVPGGVVLAEEPMNGETVYTIGLLLDHMSTYVASSENLIPEEPEEPEEPETPAVYIYPATPTLPAGTTDLTGMLSSTGQFLSAIAIYSQDSRIVLVIPEGTIGLDANQNPLTEITMNETDVVAAQFEGGLILGPIYEFGPEGSVFDPGIQIQWNYDPDDLPEGVSESDLVIVWYDDQACEWFCCECTCEPDESCVKGSIHHFSQFTLVAFLPEDTDESEVVIEPVIPKEPEESKEEREIPTLGTIIETDDEEEPEVDEAPDIGYSGINWYWWVIVGIVVTSLIIAVIWKKRRYWITG